MPPIKGKPRGKYNTKKKKLLQMQQQQSNTVNEKTNIKDVLNRVQNNLIEEVHEETNIQKPIELPIIETKNEVEQTIAPQQSGENVFSNFQDENKAPENLNEDEFSNAIVEDIEQHRTLPHEESSEDANAMLINGSMLLMFCDLIFPPLVKGVLKMITPKKSKQYQNLSKLKDKDIMLTSEQQENLEATGIADEAAKFIFKRINPITAFGLSMLIFYTSNAKSALMNLDED